MDCENQIVCEDEERANGSDRLAKHPELTGGFGEVESAIENARASDGMRDDAPLEKATCDEGDPVSTPYQIRTGKATAKGSHPIISLSIITTLGSKPCQLRVYLVRIEGSHPGRDGHNPSRAHLVV